MPGKETESSRARAEQLVVGCVSHPWRHPSPSLPFPFPSLPLPTGAGERWRSSVPGALPAADEGRGLCPPGGTCGELESETFWGIGRASTGGCRGRRGCSRAVRAAQRSIARVRPQERHGPQRPALPSARRAGTDPEQSPDGRWRVPGRSLTPGAPEVEREVRVPRGMQGRRARGGAGTGGIRYSPACVQRNFSQDRVSTLPYLPLESVWGHDAEMCCSSLLQFVPASSQCFPKRPVRRLAKALWAVLPATPRGWTLARGSMFCLCHVQPAQVSCGVLCHYSTDNSRGNAVLCIFTLLLLLSVLWKEVLFFSVFVAQVSSKHGNLFRS